MIRLHLVHQGLGLSSRWTLLGALVAAQLAALHWAGFAFAASTLGVGDRVLG